MKLPSKLLLFIAPICLSACSNNWEYTKPSALAKVSQNDLGCQDIRSRFFDSLYSEVETSGGLPAADVLHAEINNFDLPEGDQFASDKIRRNLDLAFSLILSSAINDQVEQLHFLAQLEVGSEVSLKHSETKRILNELFLEIADLQRKTPTLRCGVTPAASSPSAKIRNKSSSSATASSSSPATPTPPPPPAPNLKSEQAPSHDHLALSARQVFATAYQSCEVLKLPPMTLATPKVEGVGLLENFGRAGSGRFYQDLALIQKTHYYIKNQSYGPNCFSVRNSPLVYDFGGTPKMEQGQLNMFVNAGSGGPALGLDCSAFINTIVEHSGARYSTFANNKSQFLRFDSNDFIDPKKAGLNCFGRAEMTPEASLQSGDILSIVGHVVMVEQVGNDPFGLIKTKTIKDCEKINYQNFDFTIIQSSAAKGSIGINRFRGADYLREAPVMQPSLLTYAKAACLARYSGKPQTVLAKEFGLVRHLSKPECFEAALPLTHQECVASCQND